MEKEIKLPKSHSEISIETFEKIIDIQTKEYDSEINRCIELVSVMTGLSIDEIEEMDFEELKTLVDEVNQINVINNGSEILTSINIDGVEYGRKETKSFTVKETILFQNIFSKKEVGYLTEIAAVLYHPVIDGEIKTDYSPTAIKERKDKFKDLTMDIISPLLNKLTEFLISKNAK
jgi:hypothetical protein